MTLKYILTLRIQMWNGVDVGFIIIFIAYLSLRIKGLTHNDRKRHSRSSFLKAQLFAVAASEMAFDVLACGACLLFPR